ncbi:deoxynucleotide monophosphate kinase [Xanthobacter oligotrophicus]|uniref:Deoxynucleotide monophosphate kinase n=1 Tax=Xanthobacter oligotrophicus TaxID=2607286 RepID=A0ABW6ZS95_9HYPH
MQTMLIGFAGRAGAGKTTAARHLIERHGFERVRFAGPLKEMMRALGCTEDEIDGTRKEVPCDLLGGRTPRQAMQWLGTEWGREMIAPDLWTRAWAYAAAGKPKVVVDDVRFPNEVEAIRAFGGVVIEITTAAAANPSTLQHVSERGLLDWDFSIINPMGPSFFGSLDLLVSEPVRTCKDRLQVGAAQTHFIGALGE